MRQQRMFRRKPARDLIGGGHRFAAKNVRRAKNLGMLPALALLLSVPLIVAGIQKSEAAEETAHFLVGDPTGKLGLSDALIKRVAGQAERALGQITKFWSASPGLEQYGKIRIALNHPRKNAAGNPLRTAFFTWANEGGHRFRVVRVFGVDGEPQVMVQKIAHAVFPSPDKLIRNMMGIPMEIRFGNSLSGPMCGFSVDAWVLALRETNAYIPLVKLGPEHESWGMTTRGGMPVTTNWALHQTSYAEAGSFGDYLLRAYGAERVKAFYSLSSSGRRPWQEVFKLPLDELEKNWIAALQKKEERNVPLLVKLLKQNAGEACVQAQRLAS
jgi:hypothetical protein